MPNKYSSHIVLLSCAVGNVWTSFWDAYKNDSLKGTTRAKHEKVVRRRVVGKAAVPGNWQNFLRADSNKTELFIFLSNVFLQTFCKEDKEVVLTDRKGVLSIQQLHDVHTLAPCSHEEADSRTLLHVSHAALHGHHQMLIRTVDIDAVVLAVFAINHLHAGCELWLAFGTGKSFRYLAAYQKAASLRPAMSCALPMFHALQQIPPTRAALEEHVTRQGWSHVGEDTATRPCVAITN